MVERIYRWSYWLDGVEVVAFPLHPALVEVAAGLHGDEPHLQKCAGAFHYSVFGQTGCGGDGVVARMAGVSSAILNQQQVGVDHKRRG